MGAVQSLVLNPNLHPHHPPPNPIHLLPGRATTSIDFAAVINPTYAPNAIGTPTTSITIPTATAAPHFLFTWGDSYTSNGFNITREHPSQNDPEGLPDEIGQTTTGPGEPNWIEIVTAEGPLNTLNYDFAYGGASVDNRLTGGANGAIPDFVAQSRTFFQSLATTPHPEWAPWDSHNTEFIVWFGRNDVYWQVVQNEAPSPRLDNVIESYFHIMDAFFAVGGRRFIVLGIPPMWREPIWTILPNFAAAVEPSTEYWTKAFTAALSTWKSTHPDANVTYFDPQPIFLNFLDNPEAVGAPNDLCYNLDNPFPGNGTNCLWADWVHPAEGISAALGQAVAKLLNKQNFYADSDETTSDDQSVGPFAGSRGGFAPSYLGGLLSMIMGVLSSPMGAAWW